MEHQKQDFDIQPSMPRRAGRQQNRANPDVQTVSDHYRVTLYNVFLDHLVQEMETCILGNEERYCAQHLLPSKLAEQYAALPRPSSNIRDIHVGIF